ncbi:MAG: hypothetical protein E7480_02505 [Ruminococcaceae bacterium]|nr:hypothetical protein [Oscillospiraceae bacterium]
MSKISNVKVNGFVKPVGIDSNPVFSWNITSNEQSVYQKKYRISVSSSKKNDGDMWDSGFVESPLSVAIEYGGKTLSSVKKYYFKIELCLSTGELLNAVSSFVTAAMSEDCWQARWITGENLLVRDFELSKKISSAYLLCTGLAYYRLYINSRLNSDTGLIPSYTAYDKRIEYQCYDIKNELNEGKNTLGILLGTQYKRDFDGSYENYFLNRYYAEIPKAFYQLHITYCDGTEEVIFSDGSERSYRGPVVYSSLYDGETFDSRIEWLDKLSPDCKEKFTQTTVLSNVKLQRCVQQLESVKEIKKASPVSISERDNGDYIVDFGKNVAGRVKIKIKNCKRDEKVVITHAELLNEDGTLNRENLRTALCSDTFICNGSEYVYEPYFIYRGFRYVCVSGYSDILNPEDICQVEIRNAVEDTGYFSSSSRLINKIHNAMKLTLSNNMHSIPTDCCQRDERQGWLGDGQVAASSCIHNFNMQNFYRKWLDDISDIQNKETGAIEYMNAPRFSGGECLSWTCAYAVLVYYMYKFYADIPCVKKHFKDLQKFCEYLQTREDEQGLLTLEGLGDWLGIAYTDEKYIRDALYYDIIVKMSEMAEALGDTKSAKKYTDKAEKIKKAYNDNYYYTYWGLHPTGYYGDCYRVGQLPNALALAFDMVDESQYNDVKEKLLLEINSVRGSTQLTTGLVGTKYLFDALLKIDASKTAFDLFNRRDFPSWSFMLEKGATTIWERWQYMTGNEMNSHCHTPLAAADEWLYKGIGGFRDSFYDKDNIRVFEICPAFELDLKKVRMYQKTPWGTLDIKWSKNADNQVALELNIPANTKAKLLINGKATLLENGIHSFSFKKGE